MLTGVRSRGIAFQIALVMVAALLFMTVIIYLLFRLIHPHPLHRQLAEGNLLYGMALMRLNEMPADDRPAYLQALDFPEQTGVISLISEDRALTLLRRDIPTPNLNRLTFGPRYLPQNLPEGMSVVAELRARTAEHEGLYLEVLFRLSDGAYVLVTTEEDGGPPLIFNPVFLMLLMCCVAIVLLIFWVGTTVVRPLSELASSAASFGRSTTEPVQIEEKGPIEFRAVARAFNLMQERIQDMLAKRTCMLTAVGHDLRTPLTRLKLRLSLMEDGEQKERNLADLDMMEIQLNGALSFLKSGQFNEGAAPIDLGSFLKGIVDQYEDMDKELGLFCPTGLKIEARPNELNRALSNLIDNAFKYGKDVRLNVCEREGHVVIDVIDRGPGIAPQDRERLLEPFVRGDEARTYGSGAGLGLGLSIAKSIAEAHGGLLELWDTEGGGLTARLVLPFFTRDSA